MKKNGQVFYILIIFLNLFLFLPVFFSYGIAAPIHILIYWLSFDRILSAKTFFCNWSSRKFAGIAFAAQWLFLILMSLLNGVEDLSLLDYISNPLFIIALIITSLEFIILYFTYSKYLNKQSSKNAGG